MNGQLNNGNFMPFGTTIGSNYGFARPIPKMTQPLTKEQMNELRQKVEKFNTKLTMTDILRSKCTHRKDGDTALVPMGDGKYQCSICGAVIELKDYTAEQVNGTVTEMINILNLIKVFFYDIPEDVVSEYFQFIPYLERAPQLYSLAFDNYSRYNVDNTNVNNVYAGNDYAIWNSFNAVRNPYGVAGQPMYGQPVAPQMYPGQMYQSPTMMQQGQMVWNGGMGANPMYQNPQMQMPNQMPVGGQQVQQAPNQNPAPNTNNDVATSTTTSPITL